MLAIAGKVTGVREVSRAMGLAPHTFHISLISGMLAERNYFVGGKHRGVQVDGIFRRKLLRKKNVRGGTWPTKVVRIFRGELQSGKQIDGMKLVMGAGIRKTSEFVKLIEFLGKGGTVTNSKYMPIPIYENMPPGTRHPYLLFRRLIHDDQLYSIKQGGGRLIWFSPTVGPQDPFNVLFIGVKRIDIKRQFDFAGDWRRREPKAVERLKKIIDRAVGKINSNAQLGIVD